MFAPKVHIIMFQPQKNVTSHRLNLNRFSVSGPATTYASHGKDSHCKLYLLRKEIELEQMFQMKQNQTTLKMNKAVHFSKWLHSCESEFC